MRGCKFTGTHIATFFEWHTFKVDFTKIIKILLIIAVFIPISSEAQTKTLPIETVRLLIQDAYKSRIQDSLITVQAARIDTLMVNLSDLRVDLKSVMENFEAQLAASDRIIENQGHILNAKDKEIRKHRREKRLAIIGGIVATVAALLVR